MIGRETELERLSAFVTPTCVVLGGEVDGAAFVPGGVPWSRCSARARANDHSRADPWPRASVTYGGATRARPPATPPPRRG